MIFLRVLFFSFFMGVLSNCSQIIQTINLDLETKDTSTQEEFSVVEKTLTTAEAKKLQNHPYNRTVLQSGRGKEARPIPESNALVSNFPITVQKYDYKVGVGDELSFSKLMENNNTAIQTKSEWPIVNTQHSYKLGIGDTVALKLLREENSSEQILPTNDENQSFILNNSNDDPTINSTGRIGSDGSLLLLEVGRLEANGKTLNDLRSEVRNILIRNGVSPRFQLEIVEFKSQRAYLTISSSTSGQVSNIITLNDQKTTLVDVLTSAKIAPKVGVVTRVKLQRAADLYFMNLRDVFSEKSPAIFVNDRDHIFVEDSLTNVETSVSRVDYEGNVVFPGIGKIKAAGRSIDEIRNSIESSILQIPGSQHVFQIEITDFASHSAVINIPGKQGGIIPITQKAQPLDEILTEAGLSVENKFITRINLRRNDENYSFTLHDLLKTTTKRIYLHPNDRVNIETLPYKENKVFALGGISPKIIKINPTDRETLADILFKSGGVLESSSAKRSEVYLLRGSDPVVAYHLDAQSPTRLIVADAMELRPNDILYVAEQPIISFNRTLATIVPLRLLLRDIQDDNIP